MNSKVIVLGKRKQLRLERKSDSITAVAILSVVFPIAVVLASGALSLLSDPYSWVNFFNRVLALAGTSLLMIHLILVARIPWIEKTFGLDKLTGAHKKLGKPLMYILAVHVMLSVIASQVQESTSFLGAFFDLILGYQDLLIATVSFLLMLAVTLTSIQIARRRLKYETWYLIHLTSYIAVLLAIPHQLNFGTDFLAEPILNSYYIALYVFVLVNVVWFRSLSTVIRSYRLGLKIAKVEPAGNNSSSIYISGNNLGKLGIKSGQFFMVRIMTRRDFWRPHPFSVSSSAKDSFLRFTIGNRGDDTARIQVVKPGTRVVLEGPYGVFTEVKRTKQKVTLFAGGIGVAPIRSLAKELATVPGDVTIIYRVNSENDAALVGELEEIAKAKGHKLHVLSGQRSSRTPWLPKELGDSQNKPDYGILAELAPDIADSDIYICGPTPWVDSLNKTMSKLSIPKHQIHIEGFAW